MFKHFLPLACLVSAVFMAPSLTQAKPNFSISSNKSEAAATAVAYDCTAPHPCDQATLAECEQDLETNVCPRPDCTCNPLYFVFQGVTYSYVCNKFKHTAVLNPVTRIEDTLSLEKLATD